MIDILMPTSTIGKDNPDFILCVRVCNAIMARAVNYSYCDTRPWVIDRDIEKNPLSSMSDGSRPPRNSLTHLVPLKCG